MAIINPYLNFKGNTEEAFNFYKSVFGGEFLTLQRFKGIPEADKLSAEEQNKIMHISLPVGNGNILMATDALESMGHTFIPGNNFTLCISANSVEEADTLFNGLSAGGRVTLPMNKSSWGAYFGMLTDKFGTQWMINYEAND
jgi:PhnB protein